jgi:hypothetical protein
MRARRSPEQWSALLDELSGSGEAVESFCRRCFLAPMFGVGRSLRREVRRRLLGDGEPFAAREMRS